MGMSARLKSLMELKGLGVKEVAQLTGLTPSSISRYRSGEQGPSAEALNKLASVLEVSLDELMGRIGVPGLSPIERLIVDADEMKELMLKREGETLRDAFAGFTLPVLSAPAGARGSSHIVRIIAPADITDKDAYALRVSDDLNAPRLERGDIAFFSPAARWGKGSLCAVLLKDGSSFVRKVERRGGYLYLSAFKSPDEVTRIHERDVKALHKLVWVKTR